MKYETRFETLRRNVDAILSSFENVAHKIVVVITFVDISKEEDLVTNFEEICLTLFSLCDRITFYSIYSNDFELSSIFYQFISNMNADKLGYQNGKFIIEPKKSNKKKHFYWNDNLYACYYFCISVLDILFKIIFKHY